MATFIFLALGYYAHPLFFILCLICFCIEASL